jgi:hypothetical protein
MAYDAANHYEVSGKGIWAVVDTAGIGGEPVVSLEVDGRTVEGATLSQGERGLTVEAVVDEVFDAQVVLLEILVPRVNLDGGAATFAGVATLTTALTSIGGPGLVRGALQLYEVRPLAGTASLVQSVG